MTRATAPAGSRAAIGRLRKPRGRVAAGRTDPRGGGRKDSPEDLQGRGERPNGIVERFDGRIADLLLREHPLPQRHRTLHRSRSLSPTLQRRDTATPFGYLCPVQALEGVAGKSAKTV